jgi:2,3-bisphosphoglycerate-independent phosphoglycerate mutase
VDLKIRTIEYLEHRLIRLIYEETAKWDHEVTIAVLPDHPTYCRTRTHAADPVPFLIYRPGKRNQKFSDDFEADAVQVFDEFSVSEGAYGVLEGDGFIRAFLINNL